MRSRDYAARLLATLSIVLAVPGCDGSLSRDEPRATIDSFGKGNGKRCGNGTCSADESCRTCTQDCGACADAGGAPPSTSPLPGDWPNANTTGTSGTLTTDPRTHLSTSTTYDSIHFTDTGSITVDAKNATFKNCRFDGGVVFSGANGTKVISCEFRQGLGVSSSSNMLFERVKIENFYPADAFHVTSDGGSMCTDNVIRDSYVYNALSQGDAHSDGIQIRGSVRLQIKHCYFDMGVYREQHNAAFYSEDANGNNTDLLVENSFFKGGGYTLYLTSGTGTFQNNTVSPGIFGHIYDGEAGPGITGTGNVDQNGNPLLLHP